MSTKSSHFYHRRIAESASLHPGQFQVTKAILCGLAASERGALVEVPAQIALVQVDVAHDHHVGRVAEDPA